MSVALGGQPLAIDTVVDSTTGMPSQVLWFLKTLVLIESFTAYLLMGLKKKFFPLLKVIMSHLPTANYSLLELEKQAQERSVICLILQTSDLIKGRLN